MKNFIEYDESEYFDSPVTDFTLQFIEDMYGPEVKDMLLYKVVEHVEHTRDAV